MKIVTIHQPEHLSYLGFFHKVAMADTLVLLDNVRYEKNYFQNRNRINTKHGVQYITVPVTETSGMIKDVKICKGYFTHQCLKNVRSIEQAYSSTPFFKKYGDTILSQYMCGNTESLSTYNEVLLKTILRLLEIDVEIVYASQLRVTGAKTDLLLDICHKIGADKYISGKSGKEYLELEKFDIPVEFQQFVHPCYTQWGKSQFEPYMSVLDALFNVGSDIMQIIYSVNNGKRK